MSLSHEYVGLKISAKIKIYIHARAKLLYRVCYEVPCNIQYSRLLQLHTIEAIRESKVKSTPPSTLSHRSPYARAIIAAALVSHTLTYTFPLAQKLRVLSRVQLLYGVRQYAPWCACRSALYNYSPIFGAQLRSWIERPLTVGL